MKGVIVTSKGEYKGHTAFDDGLCWVTIADPEFCKEKKLFVGPSSPAGDDGELEITLTNISSQQQTLLEGARVASVQRAVSASMEGKVKLGPPQNEVGKIYVEGLMTVDQSYSGLFRRRRVHSPGGNHAV